MKKEIINSFLNKNVEVTFFDDKIERGILGYTPEYSAKYGYRRAGYYTINNWDFKASHIKRIREV